MSDTTPDTERATGGWKPIPGMSWRADCGQDLVCRRCLIPGRGWAWDGLLWCEPCHRAHRGDEQTDTLVLSDHHCFGEWWTDELLDRAGRGPVAVSLELLAGVW